MRSPSHLEPVVVRIADSISDRLFHFRVHFKNSTASGFGSDSIEEVALLKGFSEAVERHAFVTDPESKQGKTSSGYAAHTDFAAAERASRLELIERDAFMLSWISGASPMWLEHSSLGARELTELREIENAGFRLKIGHLAQCREVAVVVGVVLPSDGDSDFGAVLSTSASANLSDACIGVLYELRRAANLVISRRRIFGNSFDFVGDVLTAQETLEYYLNPKNFSKLSSFLHGPGSILEPKAIQIFTKEVHHEVSDLPWKIHVAKSVSTEAQNLFFGRPNDEVVNSERLKSNNLELLRSLVSPLP